ncbi:hypothetical protein PWR63_19580 [Paraburkholderia sp. A2WS-5]|uniref:hypothetical protein n=1 Tax=unclassified Paraburkholderia TaxID=2615204 RepID=UPI003B77B41F
MHRDRALADPALLLRDCDYLCCQLVFSFLLILLDFTWIKLRFNGSCMIFIAFEEALAVWPRFMRIKVDAVPAFAPNVGLIGPWEDGVHAGSNSCRV